MACRLVRSQTVQLYKTCNYYDQSTSDKCCVYSRGTLEFLTAPFITPPSGTVTTGPLKNLWEDFRWWIIPTAALLYSILEDKQLQHTLLYLPTVGGCRGSALNLHSFHNISFYRVGFFFFTSYYLLLIFTSCSSHIKLQLWLCVLNVVFYLLKPHDGEWTE